MSKHVLINKQKKIIVMDKKEDKKEKLEAK